MLTYDQRLDNYLEQNHTWVLSRTGKESYRWVTDRQAKRLRKKMRQACKRGMALE